jgi:hypothetical protein
LRDVGGPTGDGGDGGSGGADPAFGELGDPGAGSAAWGALDGGTGDAYSPSPNGEGTDHGVAGNGQLEAGA